MRLCNNLFFSYPHPHLQSNTKPLFMIGSSHNSEHYIIRLDVSSTIGCFWNDGQDMNVHSRVVPLYIMSVQL
jgi:hypothetical protein